MSSINFSFGPDTEYFDMDTMTKYTSANHCKARPAFRTRIKSHGSEKAYYFEEISQKLDSILAKQEHILTSKSEEESKTALEWQEIAEVIDRALFWVFVILTLAFTIIILVLVPLGKTVKLEDGTGVVPS